MKLTKDQITTFLIFLFFLVLPFEKRHVFFNFGFGYKYGDFAAVSLYISDLVVFLLLIFTIYEKKFSRATSKYPLFYILLFFTLFEALISPFTFFTFYSVLKWLEFTLIFLFFSTLDKKFSRATLFSIGFSGLVQSIIGISQFIKQGSLGLKILGEETIAHNISGIAKINTTWGTLTRSYGTFAHPNQLAVFLVVACATVIILLFNENRPKFRAVYIISLILLILAEILSFSRGGWIGLIITLLSIFILPRETIKKEPNYKKTLISTGFALLISIILISPFITARLSNDAGSTPNRIYYDKIGLEVFGQHLILGAGLGQMMPAVANLGNFSQTWQIQPPHNYIIDVACETGLIGLIIILYIFIKLFVVLMKKLWTGDREEHLFKIFLFSSFVAILILTQIDHYFYTLQQTQLLLWALLGIINGVIYREDAGL